MAELEREVTSMIDQRAVRAAEQSVAARKAALAAQWSALRMRMRDGVTQPATLGAVALVGGVIGWRSAVSEKIVEVECKCPKSRRSLLVGGIRALAIATLQAAASIASEEFLRSTMGREAPDEGADGARSEL